MGLCISNKKRDIFIAKTRTFTEGTLVPDRCLCMSYPLVSFVIVVVTLVLCVQQNTLQYIITQT